jgi:hypothetical protein
MGHENMETGYYEVLHEVHFNVERKLSPTNDLTPKQEKVISEVSTEIQTASQYEAPCGN